LELSVVNVIIGASSNSPQELANLGIRLVPAELMGSFINESTPAAIIDVLVKP
jgi:hypothetical protein